MSTLHQHVESLQQEIVDVLCALIQIPSLTGDESRIGAFLAEKCRKIGLEVEVIEAGPGRPNVVATWDNGEPGPTTLLNHHLAHLPPAPKTRWTPHHKPPEKTHGTT